jgi:WD40 repeat protein
MDELKSQLITLNKNLSILQERQAKYGGNAPLELVNQLDDHRTAIDLVQQALAGELTQAELEEQLAPLNLALGPGPQISMGDLESSFVAIGNGAKLIVNQALSAVEEARKQRDHEQLLLAEAVINLATRLQQVVERKSRPDSLSNPYKALLDYRLEDAALFYGRSQAIEHMLGRLDRHALTILHAESGAGKTSLLQAGLASRLLVLGDLPLHIRPWNVNPVLAVKRTILPNLAEAPGLAETSLFDFLHKVTQVLPADRMLYIFLDQFEEFFTQLDEHARQDFITQLAACLEDETLRVRWILALRKEYFGNLATFRPQVKNPFANDYYLRAMNHAEATEVIVEPARRQGVSYEPTLIDRLLADLGTNPDGTAGELAPPQIQLVCSTLFDKLLAHHAVDPQTPLLITQTMYDEEGGGRGILRGHLNRVLQRTLSEKEREIARQLLIALVSSDQRRVRRSRDDLAATLALYLTAGQSIDNVLEQLVDHRLLKVEEDEHTQTTAYELAHDYLLTEIEIDPEVQTQKAAAELLARELESYRRYGTLLSRDKYDIIHSQENFLVLDDEARELLRLSRAARHRLIRRVAGLAVVVIIALSLLAWRAVVRRIQAEDASHIAQARQLAAESINLLDTDSELSLLLALEAVEQADIVEAEDTLREVLIHSRPWYELDSQNGEVLCAAWAADGQQVALGLENGDIQLWDAATHTLSATFRGHTDPVYAVEFNPSGTYLVSAVRQRGEETDTALRLWDVASGQTVGRLEGHTGGVLSVAWSPDGARLLSSDENGVIKLWDMTAMKPITDLVEHSGQVWHVTWRPDGQKFASAGENGELFVWDAANLSVESRLIGHQGLVLGIAWSPDGSQLASTGSDATARIWDPARGQVQDVLVGHTSWVRSASWHPNGRWLATSADDTKVIIWNVETGHALFTLTGHANWVQTTAWQPDGSRLLSASIDSTARIWDVADIPSLTVLAGHVGEIRDVGWNPAGALLASGGDDRLVRLWNPDKQELLATLSGHQDSIDSIAWSPDGTQLASASADHTVRLWSAVTLQNTGIITGHTDEVYDVIWSPNGQLLATGSSDQTVQLWDAATLAHKLTLTGHERSVLGLAFSPDGQQLASASSDNNIIIWDVNSGQQLKKLSGHTSFVWDVAFTGDGQRLASASQDATVRLWDVNTGRTIAILPHSQPVNDVAWNKDETKLATASDDGQARIWDVAHREVIATLTGHQGGVWHVDWRPPDGNQLVTSATDGQVRLFLTDFREILTTAQSLKQRDLSDLERQKFMGEPVSGELER